ncbi:zinc finger C2H2 protein ECU02_0310 [Ananas comosus]|uniref:Zinc finger C2H2 protein ECU02_0310 n=1 Tax=Ananas comosus TaxID=4615 RepID=A0A199URF9_ANACO|nr:zinc finger C2H2 protein ECU02_0310 [Ananas comosus]OAY65950.1 Zinc finger protein 593 [Ananas comosus]OAY67397.1 Zinc finger protein 593 [Ananas comosus]
MGGKCPHRKVKKRRLSHKSARRSKFLVKGDDAVYSEILKMAEGEGPKPLPHDEDLPGMGQFYCAHCDRYFANDDVREEHFRSKRHKKRVKQMNGPAPHTQLDAELAAGMGMPDNGPMLMSM